jgi:hypothetical protein
MKCVSCGKEMSIKETKFIAEGEFEHGLPACEDCKKRIEAKSIRNGKSSMGRC